MSKLPKLKVYWGSWGKKAEIYDFEEVRHLDIFSGNIVVVEGQVINSYDELAQLAAQERYRDRELLEVLTVVAVGGG